ncbi:MAG TPA: undecaprenyl-diphosphate phosphatase [archaeon]|nr:undecaprenyl-diphosphate phosphatase [archaeon]
MDYLTALLLGLVQGVAEWLPISSEAMVTLVGQFVAGLTYQDALTMAIWLHLGTFLAALVYFKREVWNLVTGKDLKLLMFLGVATVLTGLIAMPLLMLAFSVEIPQSWGTLGIGLLLITMAFLNKKKKGGVVKETWEKALPVGVAQGFAALPGLSRSGLTVATLLAEGFSLEAAFRLSFLMSLPVTLGVQLVLPLLRGGFVVTGPMMVGGLVAFLVGLATIGGLLKVARQKDFFKVTLALGVLVSLLGLGLMFF